MKKILLLLSVVLATNIVSAKPYSLTSPDGKLKAEIEVGKTVEYSISHAGDVMLTKSPISIKLTNGMVWGMNTNLLKVNIKTVNDTIRPIIYKKNKIVESYNELTFNFKENYSIVFRAYNDGIAYRFSTSLDKTITIESEQASFNFPADQKAFVPYVFNPDGKKDTFEKQFHNSFESQYSHIALSEWNKKRIAFSPLVVEAVNGKKICLVESDLLNYPGMYIYAGDRENSLKGIFAPRPNEMKLGGHNMLQELVTTSQPYIAQCEGKTDFPWRGIIVAENDYELANCDFVYKLATPTKLTDLSWIKPGKVAWDWWNDWNLRNVNFKTGVNNETYQYYIDFAASKGIEYVILDEGWAVNLKADLFQVVPEIDLKKLIAYANSKKVGLILWAGYNAFNKDIEKVCKHYSEMGIKGFKVDFMDRDDQLMVDFHHRAAQIAAKYKLLLDFHGTYKPTGLQRTYPNVINFEGVFGLEQMKWADASVNQVEYDVTIPFIRMVAGPFDYTQGAMRNATRENFRPVNSEPMSQGTRCRQLAEYVIFESPLNMLCDNPSNYMEEPECTEFIAKIPTTWDETIALNGEISKYISIARRKGDAWYVGSLTNWDARQLELNLSFLGKGDYKAEIFRDGINADRVARDYAKETVAIPASKKLNISMAPGGGFVMKITKK